MRLATCILMALFLVAVPISVTAGELDDVLHNGEIFGDMRAAVEGSFSGQHPPILIEAVAYEGGVGLFQLKSLETNEISYALVAEGPDGPKPSRSLQSLAAPAAFNVVGGSNRCVINLYDNTFYGSVVMTTDLDWNNMAVVSGVNDKPSSLKTGCNPVRFFKDKNFSSVSLYVAANTNIPNLSTHNFNNLISSFYHDLP